MSKSLRNSADGKKEKSTNDAKKKIKSGKSESDVKKDGKPRSVEEDELSESKTKLFLCLICICFSPSSPHLRQVIY